MLEPVKGKCNAERKGYGGKRRFQVLDTGVVDVFGGIQASMYNAK